MALKRAFLIMVILLMAVVLALAFDLMVRDDDTVLAFLFKKSRCGHRSRMKRILVRSAYEMTSFVSLVMYVFIREVLIVG